MTIFNSLPDILRLRAILSGMDPAGPPAAHVIHRPPGRLSRVAVLAGSFNPLTNAHAALVEAAMKAASFDVVFFSLAKITIDKESTAGALLEDRLLVLREYAARHTRLGVVVTNRGLYVDQAGALHDCLRGLAELWFIVGFDKILQILDPRYYQDAGASLQTLFAQARFLVAPRPGYVCGVDHSASQQLELLLDRPGNQPFKDRVAPLPFTPSEISSTSVRTLFGDGAIASGAPPIVSRFVAATGAYQPPKAAQVGDEIDRYAIRSVLLGLLAGDESRSKLIDFRRLVEIACADGPCGRKMRQLLRDDPETIGQEEIIRNLLP